MTKKPLKVALLGAGVVGSQVARIIITEAENLAMRIGRPLELVGIGVRRKDVERPGLDPALFTDDLTGLVERPDLDLVVELIGGIEPARSLIRTALSNGAAVVTANKALLAEDLAGLGELASENRADLLYEAAVAGAIPIIRPLRESLVGDEVTAVMGIVNGTTNYILDKMTTDGLTFDVALRQAQELGFAEADPTADVEGHDAAAKAAILARLAFHTDIRRDEVWSEGISAITPEHIRSADQMDCVIKLLAIARLTTEKPQRVIVKVHPAMVPVKHPLAAVSGAFNAIFVESEEAGQLMFLGQGAGGAPTASAVMGDVVTAARNRHRGTASHQQMSYTQREVAPIAEARSRFYVRIDVKDEVGVLAGVAAIFSEHGVSVSTVNQAFIDPSERQDGYAARIGLMTHTAQEAAINAVMAALRQADFVGDEMSMMRVEGA